METIWYVRHGTSEFNLERRFGGRSDTPLAPRGIEEARRAGRSAASLRIDCVASSPLSRCRVTAEIIAEAIGYRPDRIVYSDLLLERAFGSLEGEPLRPEAEIADRAGVETRAELLERAWAANAWLAGLGAIHLLVAGHGVFGRALRSTIVPELAFVGTDSATPPPSPIPNAVITCWRCRCGCCEHVELEAI